MKYCLCCARIYAESYHEYEREECFTCGYRLIKDFDMTEEQFLKLSEKEKDEYELNIIMKCRPSKVFDMTTYKKIRKNMADYYLTFRFDKYEELTSEKAYTKENEANNVMGKFFGFTNNSIPSLGKLDDNSEYIEDTNEDKGWGYIGAIWLVVIISIVFEYNGIKRKNDNPLLSLLLIAIGVIVAILGTGLINVWFPNYVEEREKRLANKNSSYSNVVCPYCKSHNTSKISNFSKAVSVGVLGKYAMPKVLKQWHCNDCGSEW